MSNPQSEMTPFPYRRAEDTRMRQLGTDVEILKMRMRENTDITKEVRDILGTFRVTLQISKWIAGVGSAIAAIIGVIVAIKSLRG